MNKFLKILVYVFLAVWIFFGVMLIYAVMKSTNPSPTAPGVAPMVLTK